jgi:hypothetical protein
MKQLHVLSLGAGVQSTTLYLMFLTGRLTPQLDCAIFADTGELPVPVYENLAWLQSLNGPPILVRSAGRMGNDLMEQKDFTNRQWPCIPAHVADVPGNPKGMVRRRCTREYKLDVIERTIRRTIAAACEDQISVMLYIGVSADEIDRVLRIRSRFADLRWARPVFPLVKRGMTRKDCQVWLKRFGVPHEVPGSACVFCPYRSNDEWRWLRDNDPHGFQRAIDIDESLRMERGTDNGQQKFYVHRSCVPLKEAQIDTPEERNRFFARECEGVCAV